MPRKTFDSTAFDRKLEIWKSRIPATIQRAAVFVNDTLELAKASAEQALGPDAKPEHALAIYDRIMVEIGRNGTRAELNEEPSAEVNEDELPF